MAAKRLLSWLVYAIRPLRWHEIQGAASYDPEDHSFDFEEGKFLKGPKKLCGSLVTIHEDAEVRLVHLTAKLYVIGSMTAAFSSPRYQLTQVFGTKCPSNS